MAGDDWKKLPDVKPATKGGSWKDLPDVEAGADTGVPGSPLEQALRTQSGDVVTVQTPTGPAKFTRSGARFYSPEESKEILDSTKPRERQFGLEAGLSFLSGGGPLMDELRGFDAAGRALFRREGNPIDAYRSVRDDTRREVARATRRASPNIHAGGVTLPLLPVLGAAAPQLLAPNPSTWGARIALGAEQGAQNALETSEADATRGEADRIAKEMMQQGAAGGALTGVMEPIGLGIKKLAQGAGSRIGDVVAGRAAKDAADVAGEVAALRGELGGESQKMSRLFENTQRAVGPAVPSPGASPINPTIQRDAILALTDPAAARLQEKVLTRSIRDMPGQAAAVARLEHDFAEKAALAGNEASQRTAGYFKPSALVNDITPRVVTQVKKGALGAATGVPVAGGLMLAGMGPLQASVLGVGGGAMNMVRKGLLTTTRNALETPRVQTSALSAFIDDALEARKGLQSSSRAATEVGAQGVADEDIPPAVRAMLIGG